jgi:hypothetical protein
MKNTLVKILVLAAVASLSLSALAADHSVGRATVKQLDDSWQVKSLDDKGVVIGGSEGGTKLDSETKVFFKLSPKNELAGVLVIKGTSSGLDMTNKYMSYRVKCDGTADFYAKGNTGDDRRFLECMRVFRMFGSQSVMEALAPEVLAVIQKEKIVLPPNLRAVMTNYSNGNGTNLSVIAFMAPSFAGLEGEYKEALPDGVDPQTVLWAQSLQKATKDSVMSIFSKLVVPPIEFKN